MKVTFLKFKFALLRSAPKYFSHTRAEGSVFSYMTQSKGGGSGSIPPPTPYAIMSVNTQQSPMYLPYPFQYKSHVSPM